MCSRIHYVDCRCTVCILKYMRMYVNIIIFSRLCPNEIRVLYKNVTSSSEENQFTRREHMTCWEKFGSLDHYIIAITDS